jgi:hypothetical protein
MSLPQAANWTVENYSETARLTTNDKKTVTGSRTERARTVLKQHK